jgi:hypothetical protein
MKLLIDIQDDNIAGFMELINSYTSITTKSISNRDAEILEEIKEIRKAFKNIEKVKAGKIKPRPVEELFKEL